MTPALPALLGIAWGMTSTATALLLGGIVDHADRRATTDTPHPARTVPPASGGRTGGAATRAARRN